MNNELKYIKTFESFTSVDDVVNEDAVNESKATRRVKKLGDVDGLSDDEAKKKFVDVFSAAASLTTVSSNQWKKVKAKLDKLAVADFKKVLNAAKQDLEASGDVGYVGFSGSGKLTYKPAKNIKIRSAFAGGGTDSDPSGGSIGA